MDNLALMITNLTTGEVRAATKEDAKTFLAYWDKLEKDVKSIYDPPKEQKVDWTHPGC